MGNLSFSTKYPLDDGLREREKCRTERDTALTLCKSKTGIRAYPLLSICKQGASNNNKTTHYITFKIKCIRATRLIVRVFIKNYLNAFMHDAVVFVLFDLIVKRLQN